MKVTLSGKMIEDKEVHPLKAKFSTVVTLSGRMIEDKEVHPGKADV